MDISSDIKSIREILKGTHRRNKIEEDRVKVVMKFIQDMENFRKRWEKTVDIIQHIRNHNKQTEVTSRNSSQP